MQKFLISLLAFFSLWASAAPTDSDLWTAVAKDSNGIAYFILNGSLKVVESSGTQLVVVTGRAVDTNNEPVGLYWYVPMQHCDSGKGIIGTADLRGNTLFQSDFVFGIGTVASFVAEVMCKAVDDTKNVDKQKSKPKQFLNAKIV